MAWIATLLIVGAILVIILPFKEIELNETLRWVISLLLGIPGVYIAVSGHRLRLREHEKPRRESLLNQAIRPLYQKLQRQIKILDEHLQGYRYAANIMITDTLPVHRYYGFDLNDIPSDVLRDFQQTHRKVWQKIELYLQDCQSLNDRLHAMYYENGPLNVILSEVTKIIVAFNNDIASEWSIDHEKNKELEEKIAPYKIEGRNLLKYYGRGDVVVLYIDETGRLQIQTGFGSPLPYVLPFIMGGGQQQTWNSEELWLRPPQPIVFNQIFQKKRREMLSLLNLEHMQLIRKFHNGLEKSREIAQELLQQLEELVDQYRRDYGLQ